jgi:hypothetical protein
VLSFISGLLMMAADLDTFLPSWVFWVKMALVAALLVNGATMRGLERRLSQPGDEREDQWHRLRRYSNHEPRALARDHARRRHVDQRRIEEAPGRGVTPT